MLVKELDPRASKAVPGRPSGDLIHEEPEIMAPPPTASQAKGRPWGPNSGMVDQTWLYVRRDDWPLGGQRSCRLPYRCIQLCRMPKIERWSHQWVTDHVGRIGPKQMTSSSSYSHDVA